MKTTVLLVDDHTVVREGLRAILNSQPDLEVVGEAENGREAIEMAKRTRPQIVLMDVAMPLLNGLDSTRQLLRAVPQTKVLVLSGYDDDDCVNEMLRAGAVGYLLKHTAANDLANAIQEVRRGAVFLSPELVRRRKRNSQAAVLAGGQSPARQKNLTRREEQVLKLIVEGFSNKEIGVELGISIKTVEKHRQQVMNKINIHEVAGLTRYGIAHRVVELNKPQAVEIKQ